jgi:predicted nucleic acid-binding protein
LVVDFLKGDNRAVSFFEEYVFSGALTPVLSSMSVSELFMFARDKGEEMDLDHWLNSVFDIAEADYPISKEAGLLKRKNGVKIADAIIAATATANRIPLVTRSPDSYRRLDLRVFKPYV